MKRIILTLLISAVYIALPAQQLEAVRDEIAANKCLSGSNYLAYPGPSDRRPASVPDGYKPFYISHYGRHGSRYLLGKDDYDTPVRVLAAADSLNKLSPLGKEVLRKVRQMQDEAYNRYGELTERGAGQLKGIARRMAERFPQVFEGPAVIDAKSTVVIRCILSMENALQQLIAINPELRIRHDASQHDMWFMNYDDRALQSLRMPDSVRAIYDKYKAEKLDCKRAIHSLFNDENYAESLGEEADKLAEKLLMLASNVQNTRLAGDATLYDVFTIDELYGYWQSENAWWYINFGPCELNGGTQPFTQRNLLNAMIAEADSFIRRSEASGEAHAGHIVPHSTDVDTAWTGNGASLRFGHESMVLPLACLLGINGMDLQTGDLESLEREGWINYKVFPMASNIQIVFYKNAVGDIIIKVLLNENEASLPIDTNIWPYYKWSDFKQYYKNKISTYEDSCP